jgi:hypothetical protein
VRTWRCLLARLSLSAANMGLRASCQLVQLSVLLFLICTTEQSPLFGPFPPQAPPCD